MDIAEEMAQNVAEIFEEYEDSELGELQGPKSWLSRGCFIIIVCMKQIKIHRKLLLFHPS